MATTTKTLTPTNQTVTLPDMTERPNASVLVDGISKEADAINALNSKIGNLIYKGYIINLETLTLDKSFRLIFITRFAGGATLSAIYASEAATNFGTIVDNFSSGNLTVSYSATDGWTIKNNINGYVYVTAI